MTAYNAGSFLEEAVMSILSQTFVNWQLILIDNGSTDHSVELIDLSDSRICLTRFDENIGRTAALQYGLERASGSLIAILDADDLAQPARLQTQVEFMKRHPDLVLVGSLVHRFSDDNHQIYQKDSVCGEVSHDQLGERNIFVHSSVMYRKQDAVCAGGYDPTFQYAQDYDLILKLATRGKCYIINQELTSLRLHASSVTQSAEGRTTRILDEHRAFQLAASRLRLSKRGKRLNRRRIVISTAELALLHFKFGRWKLGLKAVSTIKPVALLHALIYLLRGRRLPAFTSCSQIWRI